MKIATRVDVDGFDAARRRLLDIAERARDVTPAWHALLEWWAAQNAEHFASRGARWATTRWRPLAPSTIAEKARQGRPLTPLVRRGNLARDLTSRPLGYETVRHDRVTAGTTHRAARFHQSGTRRMPRRVLVDADAVRPAATDAVRNWIVDGERSPGMIGRNR